MIESPLKSLDKLSNDGKQKRAELEYSIAKWEARKKLFSCREKTPGWLRYLATLPWRQKP